MNKNWSSTVKVLEELRTTLAKANNAHKTKFVTESPYHQQKVRHYIEIEAIYEECAEIIWSHLSDEWKTAYPDTVLMARRTNESI